MFIADLEMNRFSDIEEAMQELNDFEFHASYQESAGKFLLFIGEVHLATLANFDELHAFVAGMATVQALLPTEVKRLLHTIFTDDLDEPDR